MVAILSTIVVPLNALTDIMDSDINVPSAGDRETKNGDQSEFLRYFSQLSHAKSQFQPISEESLRFFQSKLKGFNLYDNNLKPVCRSWILDKTRFCPWNASAVA